jgi:protein TonB
MFQDLVSSRARDRGRWYTVPLSFVAHTFVLAMLIAVPLIATDVSLPIPSRALEYINHDFTPIVPAPPPELPRRDGPAPPVTPAQPGVPLVAPDGVGVESSLIVDQSTIATQSIEGVVEGFGRVLNVIEAPPVTVQSNAPVRTGGDIKPPTRTRYVAPEYPDIARRSGVEGMVIIEAIIGTDGRVENARVLRSHPLLDGAALDAVRAWEYTPTLLNGMPTAVIMTVTVRFDLN